MVEYYIALATTSSGIAERFLAVEGQTAHLDVWPSSLGTHTAEPGEDIFTTLKRRLPDYTFQKLDLGLGLYFPRIARPGSIRPDQSPGANPDQSAEALVVRTISAGQLQALIQEFQAICRVVHPTESNFGVYGHEIRNLLIIACTEVEAQWKSVLLANHAKAENRFDYVKLSSAMKLPEYEVAVPRFPWLRPIKPFAGWVPTEKGVKQVLPWYDAYNAVKHDREHEFAQGKLEFALYAIAGCFVTLCAQYGWQFARPNQESSDAFFQLIEAPAWAPNEVYLFGGEPKEVDYPF